METRHGIGTFVLPPEDSDNFRIDAAGFATAANVIELLELRIALETEAARLAAHRRTAVNLDAVKAALLASKDLINHDSDAVPPDSFCHVEVARASGNRHFTDLMTYVKTMVIPHTRVNTAQNTPEGQKNHLQLAHAGHESIYNAIRNQDAVAPRAAMRTHLSNSRKRLRRDANVHTVQPANVHGLGDPTDAPLSRTS